MMMHNNTTLWFFPIMRGPSALEIMRYQIIVTVIDSLLFVVSLFGNAFIIRSIYSDRRLRTNTNILLANMAVSDALYSLLLFPYGVVLMYVHKWLVVGDLGLAICKLIPFLFDSCLAVSTYSCLFVAIDRYYAVAHPFKGSFSQSKLKYIIPAIWVIAMIIHSPYLGVNTLIKQHGHFHCIMDWSLAGVSDPLASGKTYRIIVPILEAGVPFLTIPFIYFLIVYKLRKHNLPGQSVDSARIRRERQNKKVLKMSVVIVSLLFFSWFIYILFWLLTLHKVFDHLTIYSFAFLKFGMLTVLHLSLTYNFFILIIFVDVYGRKFKAMLAKCLCVCRPCLKGRLQGPNSTGQCQRNSIMPQRFGSVELLSIQKLDHTNGKDLETAQTSLSIHVTAQSAA